MHRSSFRAGMYLLENLTSGMYNDPLSIYREYIQNSVDSFDLSSNNNGHYAVNIDLDPFDRSIRIFDNGLGVSAKKAEEVLSSIGESNKRGLHLRGFRGIGRLGGIAFCDKAIFRTKAEGESTESIQEWDCFRLKKALNLSNKPRTFKQILKNITKFYQRNSQSKEGSYFEVILYDVKSFKNYIFDIERVRNYLSQVAPVPFDNNFIFGRKIDRYLKENLSHYGKYSIVLNGEHIYKPYRSKIRTTKNKGGGFDHIDDVELIAVDVGYKSPIAYGWYGKRRDLLGSISKGESCSGIRVRAGNILIGGPHLLDKCFREDRFNSYTVGEIHIDSAELVPNSRRDDFIDNESKALFYDAIERQIGLPISKEIRLRSRINSDSRKSDTKGKCAASTHYAIKNVPKGNSIGIIAEIENICRNCNNVELIVSKLNKCL